MNLTSEFWGFFEEKKSFLENLFSFVLHGKIMKDLFCMLYIKPYYAIYFMSGYLLVSKNFEIFATCLKSVLRLHCALPDMTIKIRCRKCSRIPWNSKIRNHFYIANFFTYTFQHLSINNIQKSTTVKLNVKGRLQIKNTL